MHNSHEKNNGRLRPWCFVTYIQLFFVNLRRNLKTKESSRGSGYYELSDITIIFLQWLPQTLVLRYFCKANYVLSTQLEKEYSNKSIFMCLIIMNSIIAIRCYPNKQSFPTSFILLEQWLRLRCFVVYISNYVFQLENEFISSYGIYR